MTGASMTVSQLAHAESPHAFRASITVYMRPNNMHAEEKGENLEGVVKEALDSLERRIRERRNKLGEPWKRPDMDSSSAQ
jgi:ribosome-associated translation inhibitor RaiA